MAENDPKEDPPAAPDDLGEAGKKALDAERANAREQEKDRKAAERKVGELEAELTKLRDANQSDAEKQLEKARNEAAEEAAKTERERWASRIVRSEVRAAAAGRFGKDDATFADPADALAFLDLTDFDVNDDGEVDSKKLTAALGELLERKPHLKADGGKPSGSIDQGVRGGDQTVDVSPGRGRLRYAYETAKK